LVSENVAYDVTGFCYYLEDGIEERNTFSYNLAAHIHFIKSPAIGSSQMIPVVQEAVDLLLPADVAASGFYITNVNNYIIGNAASGGWAGYAFPILDKPIGLHKNVDYSPRKQVALTIDGNTGELNIVSNDALCCTFNFLAGRSHQIFYFCSPFNGPLVGLCCGVLFWRSLVL
jgi:hypothetical protein